MSGHSSCEDTPAIVDFMRVAAIVVTALLVEVSGDEDGDLWSGGRQVDDLGRS